MNIKKLIYLLKMYVGIIYYHIDMTTISDIEKIKKDPKKYASNTPINILENILRKLSYLYYNTDECPVTDKNFDTMKEILEQRDPDNSFLKQIGSPVSKDKVKLPYPMGSLDKIKPEMNNLDSWKKKFRGPYELSDKLDGVSALLHKKNGVIKLYTRGDGTYGQDITHLIGYVIHEDVHFNDIPDGVAVRGELIMTRKNFEQAQKISNKLKNARNTVSGVVNSKTLDLNIVNLVDLVLYNVIFPRYKQSSQYKYLDDWGFHVVPHRTEKDVSYEMLEKYLIERRQDSIYDIDGIVVMDNSKSHEIIAGNPDYGFAFKTILKDQCAEATVIKVKWNISMDGYLKPKIKIDPIDLVGVTIQYATAHNAKFIFDNVIGPGAVVKLIRSGDVIPKIMKVIKPATSGKPQMPTVPYKWNDTEVDIIAKDIYGAQQDTVTVKKIVFFFKTLDIKYIDEGIVSKLVDAKYDNVIKIIGADEKKITQLIGEKLTEKIYKSILDALANTQLYLLMSASHLFGRGLGSKKIKIVTDTYPNIMNENWDVDVMYEKVSKLEGFQEITTTKFVKGFEKFQKFFKDLNKVVDIEYLKKPNIKKKPLNEKFKDQIFVMTGFRDKEMKDYIESCGGSVKESVSKNTTMVIVAVSTGEESSKIKKAKELGVKIITNDEFTKKYMKSN